MSIVYSNTLILYLLLIVHVKYITPDKIKTNQFVYFQNMVCPSDDYATVIITDEINRNINNDKEPLRLKLSPTTTVDSIFIDIGNYYNLYQDDLKLVIHNKLNHVINLNEYRRKTLGELVRDIKNDYTISVHSLTKNKQPSCALNEPSDDDLLLGASASPTAAELPSSSSCRATFPPNVDVDINARKSAKKYKEKYSVRPDIDTCNYVGLVNQAMTCYLNSLLQALFMTPEFRNALYNWEFDGQQIESKSIPFQLQKLFLNLQVNKIIIVFTIV